MPAESEPVFWRPEIAPGTVLLTPAPVGFAVGKVFQMGKLGPAIADRTNNSGRHVVIADQEGDLPIWLPTAAIGTRMAALIPLDDDLDLRIEVLARLARRLTVKAAGPLPRSLQLTAQRRARLILLLHALDYQLSGAGLREIAAALIDADDAALPAIEWKSSATRRKTGRIMRDAIALMSGGYRDLLRGG